MNAPITAYKGFNEVDGQLDCRGHRFVEGDTYEHDGPVSLCNSGYHACLQPLHVLRYYKPGTSVFHVVQLEDATKVAAGGDSKVAARKITIGAKVSLAGLIEAQVEWVTSRAKPVKGSTAKADNGAATASGWYGAATASGWYGAATASGRSGAATASGWYGAATASGWYGAATASGESGAATASGNSGAATASGNSGAATASGRYGAATASGRYGAATASGWYGAATASGWYGAATVEGEHSVACATGANSKAAGAVGCVLLLIERDADWKIVGHQSVMVDGATIKADTFYALRGGTVVEV